MTANEIRERARTELVVAIEYGVRMTKTIRTIAIGATVMMAPVMSFAGDEARVTYVGNGRYACSGSSVRCAQIDQSNRLQSEIESRRYEDGLARAQAKIDYQRQKEEQARAVRQPAN